MPKERPVNLNLTTIHFPVTAILSILHRLSGLALFLCLPFVLLIFSYSMQSEEHFNYWINHFMHGFWGTFLLWLLFVCFVCHFVAGIRHLLMDAGWGESLQGGRRGAILALIIWLGLSIVLGILLWVRLF